MKLDKYQTNTKLTQHIKILNFNFILIFLKNFCTKLIFTIYLLKNINLVQLINL